MEAETVPLLNSDNLQKQIRTSDRIITLLDQRDFGEVIRILEDGGEGQINLDIPDETGRYPVYVACLSGEIRVVEKMLERGCRLDVTQLGETLIAALVRLGNLRLLRTVLQADSNTVGESMVRTKFGKHPLYLAAGASNVEMFRLLLQHGALLTDETSIQVEGKDGTVMDKRVPVLQSLAIIRITEEMIDLILERVSDINRRMWRGETLLATSTLHGNYSLAHRILQLGGDPDIPDYRGDRPVHIALRAGQLELFSAMLRAGVDPNMRNHNSDTLYHVAITSRNLRALDMLLNHFPLVSDETECPLDRGAMVETHYQCNIMNNRGQTALHLLLTVYGKLCLEHVRILLPYTNLNLPDNSGTTVLHSISQLRLWGELRDLLQHKALAIGMEDREGQTPLTLVPESDREEVLEITVRSYYNLLVARPGKWNYEWQRECSEGELSKVSCLEAIREHIRSGGNTYPQRAAVNISLELEADSMNYVFQGESYYNYCNVRLLRERNPGVCFNYWEGVDVESLASPSDLEFSTSSAGFTPPVEFQSALRRSVEEGKPYYTDLSLTFTSTTGHANCIIYRPVQNTLERFDPEGSREFYGHYNDKLMDTIIQDYFTKHLKVLGVPAPAYYRPSDYQTDFSFQSIGQYEELLSSDPGGYCAAWTVWYADYRLHYVDLEPRVFHDQLLSAVRRMGVKLNDMIRNYAGILISILRQAVESIGIQTFMAELRDYEFPLFAKAVLTGPIDVKQHDGGDQNQKKKH